MKQFKPKTIYIDTRAKNFFLTGKVLRTFPHVSRVLVQDTKTFIKEYNRMPRAITQGKRDLFLTINKGAFVKKCPGTKHYRCCGYQILHQAAQCSIDCSYCILQSYFNNPLITLFTNCDDMLTELESVIRKNPNRLWRIGTGEFTDSLALDYLTGLSKKLIPFFMRTPNAVLELKTKTTNIENLMRFRPRGKIITAWSLNAERIVAREERHAPSIRARLYAARRCAERGFRIAFHFDPIFYYPGWEEEYGRVIRLIFRSLRPEAIAWISLGCFRFIPSLKGIIEERFPRTTFIYDEFIKGLDGKMRYVKPVRIHVYSKMIELIKRYNSNVFIYLCMESDGVWKRSFGYTPRRFGSLTHGLDCQVFTQAQH